MRHTEALLVPDEGWYYPITAECTQVCYLGPEMIEEAKKDQQKALVPLPS